MRRQRVTAPRATRPAHRDVGARASVHDARACCHHVFEVGFKLSAVPLDTSGISAGYEVAKSFKWAVSTLQENCKQDLNAGFVCSMNDLVIRVPTPHVLVPGIVRYQRRTHAGWPPRHCGQRLHSDAETAAQRATRPAHRDVGARASVHDARARCHQVFEVGFKSSVVPPGTSGITVGYDAAESFNWAVCTL